MAIRLVAIDVDDTLITDELTVPSECEQAIRSAQDQGVEVVLATGRMFQAALPFAQALGLTGPLILYNGALVKTVNGKVLNHWPVPLDLAKEIAKLCHANYLHLNVYLDDELYVERLNEHAEYYQAMTGVEACPVGNLVEFMDREPTKLLIVGYAEELVPWRERLARQYEGRLEIARSKPRYIEITRLGISKGAALETVAARLGLQRNEVMAIGDSFNDVSMLKFAGVGVAVGNAPDAVKEVADWVAPSNKEAGVAEAIRRFVLKY